MNALWWWIDRWRKSTAFTDMTLEQQGAYRNLLDEAWLRGGALPVTDRSLARASGDPARWRVVRKAVLSRFTLARDGCYHNETLDGILKESRRRAEKQRAYRARLTTRRVTGNGHGNKGGSPSLSINPPIVPPRGTATRRRRRPDVAGGSTCQHAPRCRTTSACIARTLKEQS